MSDPILHHVGVVLHRTLLFVLLSAAQAIALWLCFWTHFKSQTLLEAARYLADAWPMSMDSFVSVQAMGMLWISCADTAILYLLIGHWWTRRADVLHRRGSRFADERGGE